jgi:hypothetical protein
MSLYDFFFPEQSQAAQLRQLVEQNRRRDRRQRSAQGEQRNLAAELESLREDVGYLALLLAAIGHRLDQKGVITRADLRAAAEEIDAFDSVKDGKLDVQRIKDALREGLS